MDAISIYTFWTFYRISTSYLVCSVIRFDLGISINSDYYLLCIRRNLKPSIIHTSDSDSIFITSYRKLSYIKFHLICSNICSGCSIISIICNRNIIWIHTCWVVYGIAYNFLFTSIIWYSLCISCNCNV